MRPPVEHEQTCAYAYAYDHDILCRVGCERRASFTCQEACDRLNADPTEGLRFPTNLTCPVQGAPESHSVAIHLLP